MRVAQLKICTNCLYLFAYEFSICGTEHPVPQPIRDIELAEYLREGWTATFHDHAGPQDPD
jgi:hypothetical protein